MLRSTYDFKIKGLQIHLNQRFVRDAIVSPTYAVGLVGNRVINTCLTEIEVHTKITIGHDFRS